VKANKEKEYSTSHKLNRQRSDAGSTREYTERSTLEEEIVSRGIGILLIKIPLNILPEEKSTDHFSKMTIRETSTNNLLPILKSRLTNV
jgi:hypothetical protein